MRLVRGGIISLVRGMGLYRMRRKMVWMANCSRHDRWGYVRDLLFDLAHLKSSCQMDVNLMNPCDFPEANCSFKAPSDMDGSQCGTISAFRGTIGGGNIDGAEVVVVAWKPTEQELEDSNNGQPVFLLCVGGLPPHSMTTRPVFQ